MQKYFREIRGKVRRSAETRLAGIPFGERTVFVLPRCGKDECPAKQPEEFVVPMIRIAPSVLRPKTGEGIDGALQGRRVEIAGETVEPGLPIEAPLQQGARGTVEIPE
ncbi:MAG: hypothetical protein HZB86_01150 [Deltaproteobacteria bacterium]|nr:hypothetical protein [Deltaproteobacteria bacterium]